eukprot:700531-Pleurochrysis_carterae.AAC.1
MTSICLMLISGTQSSQARAPCDLYLAIAQSVSACARERGARPELLQNERRVPYESGATVCGPTYACACAAHVSAPIRVFASRQQTPSQFLFAVSRAGVEKLQTLQAGDTFLMRVPKFILDHEQSVAERQLVKVPRRKGSL